MKKILLTKILLAMMIVGLFVMVTESVKATTAVTATLLNQAPDPAGAGETAKIRIIVENSGDSAAKDLSFEMLDVYPFTVLDNDRVQNISSLNANSVQAGSNYVTLEYNIKVDNNAHQGSYPIQLKYIDSSGVASTFTYYINVVNQNYAQIIYVDKSQLQPGQPTDMNFTITNVGNSPLQNLIFSWNEKNGVILPVFSDDHRYIKFLDIGQSVQLSYKVIADVNANPGLYQLDLNLNYQSLENSSQTVLTTKAGVFVGGQTDFDVVFSQTTQGQTSLSVSNIGNTPAQSVSVSIPQQPGYQVSGSNSAIIGNLNKGDYTLVSFQITARGAGGNTTGQGGGRFNNQNLTDAQIQALRQQYGNRTGAGAGGQDGLLVDVSYTDTTGQRVVLQKTVQVQFRGANSSGAGSFGNRGSSTSAGFIGGTVFWIIIVVVVLGAAYLIFGRKKKSNNAANPKTSSKK